MKRLFWTLTAAAALAAFSLLTACDRPQTVRLMTYNVGAFGKELEDSAPMIAAMIAELGAETVALNELDSCNRRHGIDQVQHLADELNGLPDGKGQGGKWSGRFGRAMAYAGGAYGCGIVTKERVLDHFNIALPREDGSEPRVCVVVETPRYVYAACHLDHISEAARMAQARVMTETLTRRYGDSGKPVFVAGDFNDTPDSPLIRWMSRNFTLLTPLMDSYSAKDPYVCIDYVFLLHNGARVAVKDGGSVTRFESGDVCTASDHLPVFVDVVF